MLAFIVHQEVCKKLQDVVPPTPASPAQRVASALRAARGIFWNWQARVKPPATGDARDRPPGQASYQNICLTRSHVLEAVS